VNAPDTAADSSKQLGNKVDKDKKGKTVHSKADVKPKVKKAANAKATKDAKSTTAKKPSMDVD
jgi:hypothetical protein